MNQISIKSIIIKLLKNRKISVPLLIIPIVLGLIMGVMKGTGTKTEISESKKDILGSKVLQYNSLRESNEKLSEYVKNSVYLNLDKKSIFIKEYRVFVNIEETAGTDNSNVGFYYVAAIPDSKDYAGFRSVIGTDISDEYINELIPVNYAKDTGILTVSGIYSDKAVAEKLAYMNLDRIMKLFESGSKDHKLEVVGSRIVKGPDQAMIDKLTAINNKIDDQTASMNKLQPAIVQYGENIPAVSKSGLLRSIIKWGVLGLFGGVALALVYGLVAASSGRPMTTEDLSAKTGIDILGFIENRKLSLTEKLQAGNVSGKDSETEKILSSIGALIKNHPDLGIYIAGENDSATEYVLNHINGTFRGIRSGTINIFSKNDLSDINEGDVIIIHEKLSSLDHGKILAGKKISDCLGMKTAGILISN